jgi:arginine utilization protein RocB
LYYAAPYCPHNTLQGEDEILIDEIRDIASAVSKETGEEYRMMKFFPSLSDSSYLKIDDTMESIEGLQKNFPGFDEIYPLPIEKIIKLSVPAVNYGCYGKDAHKWTERVNLPYTFGVLPIFIQKTIDFYLNR